MSDDRLPRPRTLRHAAMTALGAMLCVVQPILAQEETFELSPEDTWTPRSELAPDGPQARLLRARRAILEGDPQRGEDIATAFIDQYPNSPLLPEAYLIRGDALLAAGDEYEALFDYEEIARSHPNSAVFVTALEREFEIAKQYANGRLRKFLGILRILPAEDDAQEILIRIQERLPGSRLAEDAGMELADFYFRKRDLRMAADAYDLFVENYPRSKDINKARLRLIYSYLADYRGPRYDASGLEEARLRLEDLRVQEPGLAQRIGVEALLVRIYESDARKMLVTAEYYLSVSDPVSAEFTIRRLLKRYPDSIASLEALRRIPAILRRVPEAVVRQGPDYRALREEKLGIPWDQDIDLSGVTDPPVPVEPEIPATSNQVPTSPPAVEPTSARPQESPTRNPDS
ncbi:MAG: outer membrane protein assembly factor BamD [Planctomycetota bacterium]|nr:outer membrane protein assembly factor BamD [Planctomycetota bacterium]